MALPPRSNITSQQNVVDNNERTRRHHVYVFNTIHVAVMKNSLEKKTLGGGQENGAKNEEIYDR